MPIEVILPKVDMDMDDGIITEWKVAPGDRVRQGQILFDIETNKSVMEVESPGSGVIRDLAPITGEPVAVGTIVGWIDADGDAGAASPATADRTKTTSPSAITAKVDDAAGVDHATSSAQPAPATPATVALSDSIRATPLARRAARMLDVNLADVVGSGPAGRIVEKDVAAHAGPTRETSVASTDRLVPFNPVRRIVAQRLAESARSAPHFFLSAQIEMSALQAALRSPEGQRAAPDRARPSMTVALAYLAGRVLALHPLLNASIEGDAVRLHARVNIGVAIDDQGDLFVPVLRDVPSHTLDELARDFARLRAAVRAREIVPDDMRGGTFTISNLGMYGVDAFTAIINPPESAILAIGRTTDTPVGRDGKVVLRPMATFTLSSDHRIVDGVTAARFIADLREAIEHPEGLS
jgi:pyruvate dehydrogenase E2 component (dihydrolipoyllysine-residue acetyltransferase)